MHSAVRLDAEDNDKEHKEEHAYYVRNRHPGHLFNSFLQAVVDEIRCDVESRGFFGGPEMASSEGRNEEALESR